MRESVLNMPVARAASLAARRAAIALRLSRPGMASPRSIGAAWAEAAALGLRQPDALASVGAGARLCAQAALAGECSAFCALLPKQLPREALEGLLPGLRGRIPKGSLALAGAWLCPEHGACAIVLLAPEANGWPAGALNGVFDLFGLRGSASTMRVDGAGSERLAATALSACGYGQRPESSIDEMALAMLGIAESLDFELLAEWLEAHLSGLCHVPVEHCLALARSAMDARALALLPEPPTSRPPARRRL